MSLNVLVTGTGRCGTGFMAKFLTSAGLPCRHEQIFDVGDLFQAQQRLARTAYQAESSWLAAPFLSSTLLKNSKIVHLVRHPQQVVESLLRMRFFADEPPDAYRRYQDFAYKHLPGLRSQPSEFERAAFFYVHWNRLVERLGGEHDMLRFRIEDDPRRVLDWLGIDPGHSDLFGNRRYNSRGGLLPHPVDFGELPSPLQHDLRAMLERYGYEVQQPAQPERPAVYWATLFERATPWQVTDAMLNVAARAGQLGFPRITVPYTATDNARNHITQTFQQVSRHPDDVLIMLDGDHRHPPEILERLAAHSEGVVGALAFRRSPPYDPLFFVRAPDGRLRQPAEWQQGTTYVCDAVGTGAIAIKRCVFDRLQKAGHAWPWFRYEYPASKRRPSEDMYFARICEETGIHHHCDTGVVIPHLRVGFVDEETWVAHSAAHPELVAAEEDA
jgi:hypothetical protein